MNDFKAQARKLLVSQLQQTSFAVAAYEGGSTATGTSDQYSDIDLVVVAAGSVDDIFKIIETALGGISKINHTYHVPKTMWPGLYQKFYFLENAPKHFFVDAAVLLTESKDLLQEFMQTDRHGMPTIYFDKTNILKPQTSDSKIFLEKHKMRLAEIVAAYPVFKTTVLKELDRGNSIDAFSFYFSGMIRPLVEMMGMLYRPFKYDFGFRYLHKHFPPDESKKIENFMYLSSMEDLKLKVHEVDQLFQQTVIKVKEVL